MGLRLCGMPMRALVGGSILILILSLGWSVSKTQEDLTAPVRADAMGYFSYLPAVFVEGDLSFEFMINDGAQHTGGVNTFEANYNPQQAKTLGFNVNEDTGRYFNKYPVGVAVLLVPFYLLGHLVNLILGLGQGGFGPVYQYAAFAGGFVYGLAGLYLLQLTLQRQLKFPPSIVILTLVTLVFGTNLLNYLTFENIYSHVYSFFLLSLLIYLTPRLKWARLRWGSALPLAIVMSLIVMVRQYNLMFALVPLFYLLSQIDRKSWQNEVKKVLKWPNLMVLIGSLVMAVLVFLPQILYWYYASGSLVAYSYTGEGFSLDDPRFFDSLFSLTRGLFFWSPVLLFGFGGMLLLRGENRHWKWSFLTIFALTWLIVSTWSSWTFGWGHGHRVFVDMLPLFAISLASFFGWVLTKSIAVKRTIVLLCLLLVCLSFFQTLQYWRRIIPPDLKTWEDYQKIFLRLDDELIEYWK